MTLFFTITIMALGLDAITKLLTARLLQEETVQWGWFVRFQCTRNTGMAFGMLSDNAAAGILLPLAVIAAGAILIRRYRMTPFTRTACGLILGGFLGNFIQRLISGYVLDMIYFPWLPFFVCNVADICICFGVALLAFSLLLRPQDWEEVTNAEN